MRDIAASHGVLCCLSLYYFFSGAGVVVVVVDVAFSVVPGAGVVVVDVDVDFSVDGAAAGAGAGAGAGCSAFLQPTAKTASSMSERTIANTFFILESPPSKSIWAPKLGISPKH